MVNILFKDAPVPVYCLARNVIPGIPFETTGMEPLLGKTVDTVNEMYSTDGVHFSLYLSIKLISEVHYPCTDIARTLLTSAALEFH